MAEESAKCPALKRRSHSLCLHSLGVLCGVSLELSDGFIVKRKHIPGAKQRHASTNKSWPRKLQEVERFLWQEMRLERKTRAQL